MEPPVAKSHKTKLKVADSGVRIRDSGSGVVLQRSPALPGNSENVLGTTVVVEIL